MAETVAEIADLGKLDGKRFFDETHVTEGMATLLRQVFQRLTGESDQGVYRLKQAMGGGKTHNLLAAALLARDPGLRKSVLSKLGVAPDKRTIRVCAFSGRETDMQDYLWVRIFRDLGREAHWSRTAEVPGPSTWAKVIGEEPALILLDELPPYFVSLGSQQGSAQSSEADRLAIALANLMNAILSNKLPNCCLVISDLTGSWADGSARVQQAVNNATNEVTRAAMDLIPVRLDSGELYGILQRKLFEKLPGENERRKVGQQYASALRTAIQQGIVPESYERWAQEVAAAYPFHPGLHELFARFRENEDFQQTRGTLRLAQRMVSGAWAGKAAIAETALLLHPHMVDLADRDTASTFERINPSLNNARARDIATIDGTGIAQKISINLGDPTAADTAKLLFVSSLPVGPNALQGLNAEEVAAYLAAPGRDVSSANAALMIRLEEDSWYLHRRTDGRWHYRNVKNVTSAIRDRVETLRQNERITEVANYLRATFDPAKASPARLSEARHAYQKLLVFPAPADIPAAVTWSETLLVIVTPSAGGFPPELARVWDSAVYQNRLLFLFGSDTFTKVTMAAAYKKAAEDQVGEFVAQKMNDSSPEMMQARDALERNTAGFLSALRETFTQLYFPDHTTAQLRPVALRLDFTNNQFVGQLATLDTLLDQQKFRKDVDTDSFRAEFETYVFRTQEATWRSLMEATARQVDWYLVPPGGHETMRTKAFTQDVWRDDGGDYIKKGPFPQDPTSVQAQLDFRDPSTGRCSLRIVARHADRVHYEEGGSPATVNSPVVQNGRLETTALKASFLAIDSSGLHEPGPAVEWQSTIEIKYDVKYRGGAHHVTLKALPQGTIRYSLDGSDPRNGAIYDDEFAVPGGITLVLAVAEHAGIASSVTKVPIPILAGGGPQQFRPNPTQKAEWTRPLSRSDRAGSYKLLQVLKRHAARLGGASVNVSVAGSEHWIDVSAGRSIVRTADQVEELTNKYVEELRQNGPNVAVTLTMLHVYFDSGSALEEAARELSEPLNADEVKQ
ncbi:MAG: DUF499 domain-containing protein [Hyphomicrobiaceae bacterium]